MGNPIGTPCSARGGYEDIGEGGTVRVRNAQDKVIGVGALRAGHYVDGGFVDKLDSSGRLRNQHVLSCVFPFSVKVPTTSSVYTVEVAHRGSLTYTKKKLVQSHWNVALTLGS